MDKKKSLVVISSPSGGGKSTLAKYIMQMFPNLKFSISATTRPIREGEINGKDYYFLTKPEFIAKTYTGELIEFEEIYGNYYGTLKSEIDKLISENSIILLDIDVKGAINIKNLYHDKALLIFIEPPSIEVAEARLRGRKSESETQIKIRLERYQLEVSLKNQFDYIIINDDLEKAKEELKNIISKELF